MKHPFTNFHFHRRALLMAGSLLVACSQQAAQTLTPVEITRATACSLDGMILADYPGPKAQIHYAGQAEPDFFCDLMEVFNVMLKPEQTRKVLAVYVQDMGQADWNNPQDHWIDAKTAFYVLGSKKMGSMGPTLGSFAKEEDAKKFAAAYGGKVLKFGEVTPAMVALDGGALHDQRM